MRRSYTQYSTHKKCGAKFAYQYIERLPMPPKSASAARGTSIHDRIEGYFKGSHPTPPDEAEHLHEWMEQLKAMEGVVPEYEFLLTEDWVPTDNKQEARYHGFVDLLIPSVGLGYEWKSGQRYDDHPDQRQFYTTAILSAFPEMDSLTIHGVYIDKGDVQAGDAFTLRRDMLPHFQNEWKKRMTVIDNPLTHIPSPGPWCRWCPFKEPEGGPCKFGK